jgi:F-type H+-transporting ATPase subunit epsilon
MLYGRTFPLRIITPSRIVFEGDVSGVRVPGSLSPFEVLSGHVPLVSSLDVGEVRITHVPNSVEYLSIGGGVIEVTRHGVTLLADSAEKAVEIDVGRASAARDRALQRLRHASPDTDIPRAEAALARSLNRLSVAHRGS